MSLRGKECLADGPSRVARFKRRHRNTKASVEATESARVQQPSKGSGQEDPGETPWGVRASYGALVRHLKCSPELENQTIGLVQFVSSPKNIFVGPDLFC